LGGILPKNGTKQSYPISDDELERILALKRFEILDTEPEEAFERIARTVVTIFEAPVVAVSLVDENRLWFKSCYGLDVTETSRDVAFCTHTIMRDEIMIVNDATKDPRFQNNPLVTGDPAIRFYAGAPLDRERVLGWAPYV
jgi:GAF domain-containing protein